MYSAWGVPAQTRARVRWWCGPRHGLAYTQPSACDPFSLQPELSKRNNFPLKYGCVLSERSTTGRTMWKMWPFSELFGLNSPLKLPAPQLRLSRAILSCKDFLKKDSKPGQDWRRRVKGGVGPGFVACLEYLINYVGPSAFTQEHRELRQMVGKNEMKRGKLRKIVQKNRGMLRKMFEKKRWRL